MKYFIMIYPRRVNSLHNDRLRLSHSIVLLSRRNGLSLYVNYDKSLRRGRMVLNGFWLTFDRFCLKMIAEEFELQLFTSAKDWNQRLL